jgi:hypothetical protein
MKKSDELHQLMSQLEVKLKIPRHHFKFLQEHGALEEFVLAKHSNDNDGARQALDKAVKIDQQKKKKLFTMESMVRQSAGSALN